MSVVVWDGKTLAADRQGTEQGLRIPFSKMRQVDDRTVVAWTGTHEQGLVLVEWYQAGADPKAWPESQSSKNWCRFIVASNDAVFWYDQTPTPQTVASPYWAWGCGKEFALGALAMGADARRAVEIACRFSNGCGLGTEAYDLVQPGRALRPIGIVK